MVAQSGESPSAGLAQLLSPGGRARRVVVLGDGCPRALRPGKADLQPADGVVDVAIVAPAGREARSPEWVAKAAAEAVTRVADDGLVYVVAPLGARRLLARRLAAGGLRRSRAYLHVVRVGEVVYVVELERRALVYALRSLIDAPRWKRRLAVAALTLGSPALPLVWRTPLPSGVAFQRRGSPSPAAWLTRGKGWLAACVGPRHPRRVVLFCGAPGTSRPSVVARPAARSSPAADAVRAVAGSAGARVPEPVELPAPADGLRVETGVTGVPAALSLAGRPRHLAEVLAELSAWLGAWNERSSRSATLTRQRLEAEVLEPAARLAAVLPAADRYLARLERLGSDAIGSTLPSVAVHDDLTMWNVLLESDERIGIVDWDKARPDGMPVTDYVYAVVDAFAATERYADRLEAFRRAFGVRGHAEGDLPFDLDAGLMELCFHSCWLRHAANDLDRDDRDAPRRGFLAIARALAAGEPWYLAAERR